MATLSISLAQTPPRRPPSPAPGAAAASGIAIPGAVGDPVYLPGSLPNTPENLMTWIRDPQRVHFPTAMPDRKVTGRDARDIAAYPYTLR